MPVYAFSFARVSARVEGATLLGKGYRPRQAATTPFLNKEGYRVQNIKHKGTRLSKAQPVRAVQIYGTCSCAAPLRSLLGNRIVPLARPSFSENVCTAGDAGPAPPRFLPRSCASTSTSS